MSRRPFSLFRSPRFSIRLCAAFLYATLGTALFSQEMATDESAAVDSPTVMLEAFKVSESRVAASDVEGPSALDRYDSQQIEDTGAFDMDELFATLPSSGGDEEVLVLIDGEPAYIDPSTIPLGMVEGIEVSADGSMPEYGAQSGGRIINIRLKKNYSGAEAGAKMENSFAGGGARQSFRLSTSAAHGKWRTLVAVTSTKRSALAATDRDFYQQDHTAWGGSDLRLAWGSPAVIQAVSGPLNGLVDADGNPVESALVPENQNGTALTPADFLPGSGDAARHRRFDTSPYRLLVSPSERLGATASVSYPVFGEHLRVSLASSFTKDKSDRLGPPPVSTPSAKTLVPAAYNPFGQDVEVGFVHTEFGPTHQQSRSDRAQLGLKLNGRISPSWKWNGGIGYSRNRSSQTATDLDDDLLAAALAAPDPSGRFNPFGDPAAGPVNAQLYPQLTFNRTSRTDRSDTRFDLGANGSLAELWGGPLTLALRGGYQIDDRTRLSQDAPGVVAPESHFSSHSQSASSSLNIPLAGRKNQIRLLNRLELRLSARHSNQDDGSEGTGTEAGFVWSPLRALLIRARVADQSSVASRDVSDRRETLVSETVLDPRRELIATETQIVVHDIASFSPEKRRRETLGLTLEPPFLKGLRLSGAYQVDRREDLIQRRFDPQDIVNNEAAFPGRVVRAAATTDDIAAGRPGAIQSVDTTPGNSGRVQNRSLDLRLDYAVPAQRFGRIRFSGSADRAIENTHEIAPGLAFIHDDSGRSNPPKWEFNGSTSWNCNAWMASMRVDYTGRAQAGLNGEGIPAQTLVSLNAGWRFKAKIAPTRTAQYRIAVGIGNLFDRPPSRADTISGYRGGSPVGRTYQLTLSAAL
jgi:iron complex outermembrane receptor protein